MYVAGGLVAGIIVLSAGSVQAAATGHGDDGLSAFDNGVDLILRVVEHDLDGLEAHGIAQHAHVFVLAVDHGLVQGQLVVRHGLGTEVGIALGVHFRCKDALDLGLLLENIVIGKFGIHVAGSALAEHGHGLLAEHLLDQGAGVAGEIGADHTADEEVHRVHAIIHIYGDGYIFLVEESDDREVLVRGSRPVGSLLPFLALVVVVAVDVQVKRAFAEADTGGTRRRLGIAHGLHDGLLDLAGRRDIVSADTGGTAAVGVRAGNDDIRRRDAGLGSDLADHGIQVVAVGIHRHDGRGRLAVGSIDRPDIEFSADDVRGIDEIALRRSDVHFRAAGYKLLGGGEYRKGQKGKQGQDSFHIIFFLAYGL